MLQKTYIIAECGLNHQGNITVAKQMIAIAKSVGCDCVKFQCFYEGEVNGLWPKLEQYHFGSIDLVELKEYCEKLKIDFLCSAFGLRSLNVLRSINCKILKIPSGKIVDKKYLEYAAKNFDKFILSTGMADFNEIEIAYEILNPGWEDKIILLHCVSAYPAPVKEMNLEVIRKWRENELEPFIKVGLSDHTLVNEIAIAAVAMGAEVIEKHFTLSRNMKGPDHSASIEPLELLSLVRAIRNVEAAMGTGEKKCQESEKVNLFRRRNNE